MWHKKDSFSREGLIEWVLPRLIERVLLMSQSTYTHPKMMTVAPSAMFLVWMSHIVLYIHRSEGGYSCMNVSYLWVLLMSTKWRTRSMSHVVLYMHRSEGDYSCVNLGDETERLGSLGHHRRWAGHTLQNEYTESRWMDQYIVDLWSIKRALNARALLLEYMALLVESRSKKLWLGSLDHHQRWAGHTLHKKYTDT